MNILYISELEGGKYTGPIYSVPNQISAQSKIDNIYWINLTKITFQNQYYNYCDLKKFKLDNLPEPFNHPDLVIFEEFFKLKCCLIAFKLKKLKIPYIIVPRCQMTEKYLQNKWLKKKIASILLFKRFAKYSSGVQFLSEQEKKDSEHFYNKTCEIIPNGITLPLITKQDNNDNNTIKCTFIGRYSIWQKGLDLLISAIKNNYSLLKEKSVTFNLYGPDERTGNKEEIEKLVIKNNLNDIVKVNGPVFDKEKEEILRKTTVFIHTSRFEGLPMSVLEALSYGLPCFLTQGSNLREKIEETNSGWGCDTNEMAITNALNLMCNELENINVKKLNALKLAECYSWKNISIQTHIWYEKIINAI